MAVTLRFNLNALKHIKLQNNDVNKLLTVSLQRVLPALSLNQSRKYSFFSQSDNTDKLYGSLTGVSNTGMKRGRGRGLRKKVNLNRGQVVGESRSGMKWPGLNEEILSKNKELMRISQQTPNEEYFNKLIKLRSEKTKFAVLKTSAIERGWTGTSAAGRSFGPPDPIGDYTFDGFDTKCLQLKKVCNMTATKKNRYRWSCMVVTGNGNGLGGLGMGKATNAVAAKLKAKSKAAQHLQHVERYEGHTLYHNFYTKEQATKIFAYRKEEGYGLVCHRCLKTISETIGIRNMYAKVEGSTKNIQVLANAFFNALRRQETHQELADRLKLHVVEFRAERGPLPIVVASPSDGIVRKEPLPKEKKNLDNMYFENKLPLLSRKQKPFYQTDLGHMRAERRKKFFRNVTATRVQRIVHDLEPKNTRWTADPEKASE